MIRRSDYLKVWFCWALGGALVLPVTGEMIFGVLGLTPEDPAWRLATILGGFLALIALRLPIEQFRLTGWQWLRDWGWIPKIWMLKEQASVPNVFLAFINVMLWASRLSTGGLVGFFHGGHGAGNELWGAIAGLAMGLFMASLLGHWGAKRYPRLEQWLGGAIAFWAAYSLWLWLAAWGLSALLAQRWLSGGLYCGMALIFCQWTWLGKKWLSALNQINRAISLI